MTTIEQENNDKALRTFQAITKFAVMFKICVETSYEIKGQHGQRIKEWTTRFNNTGNSLLRELESYVARSESSKAYFEDYSGFLHDVVFEALKAKNPGELTALLRCYNEGNVIINPEESKPKKPSKKKTV